MMAMEESGACRTMSTAIVCRASFRPTDQAPPLKSCRRPAAEKKTYSLFLLGLDASSRNVVLFVEGEKP